MATYTVVIIPEKILEPIEFEDQYDYDDFFIYTLEDLKVKTLYTEWHHFTFYIYVLVS